MLPFLLLGRALAGGGPVVVRIDATDGRLSPPLVAHLTAGDKTTDVPLVDLGQRPDVTANDGRFAGVARVEGAELKVSLSAGGSDVGSTTVHFSTGEGPRDIDLTYANGQLLASGSTPEPGDGTVAPAPAAPEEGATPAAATAPEGAAPSPTPDAAQAAQPAPSPAGSPPASPPPGPGGQTVTFPTEDSGDDGLLFIGFGVGLFVLMGLGWVWMRGRGAPEGRPADVTLVPEPGLLGDGSPSVSDGLSAWVGADGAGAFQDALVQRLALHHRVLFAARAEVPCRPVHGGPVYRVQGVRPSLVADAADALAAEPGAPLVVVVGLDAGDAGALREYRDALPKDVGGLVLLPAGADVGVPRVDVTPTATGWAVRLADGRTVHAVTGPRGLERADAAGVVG